MLPAYFHIGTSVCSFGKPTVITILGSSRKGLLLWSLGQKQTTGSHYQKEEDLWLLKPLTKRGVYS
jgi:hypothetical protein